MGAAKKEAIRIGSQLMLTPKNKNFINNPHMKAGIDFNRSGKPRSIIEFPNTIIIHAKLDQKFSSMSPMEKPADILS